MTSHVTTHVLDAAAGTPAAGVGLTLSRHDDNGLQQVATASTNENGRNSDLGPTALEPGIYQLVFATGEYFAARGTATFYPRVTIDFHIRPGEDHYHVPLLLSPFAYSTYRGS